MLPVPLVSIATALAAIPPAVLARRVWRDLEEPGAKPFAANLVVIVVFDLVFAVSMQVSDPGVQRMLFFALSSLVLLTSVTWLVFALEYTGRVRVGTRPFVVGLLGIPAVAFVLFISPGLSRFMLMEYEVVQVAGAYVGRFTFGSIGRLFMLFGFLSVVAGLVMLLRFVVSERHRYGLQASVLSLVVGLHHVTIVDRVFALSPIYPVNLSPFAWALGSLIVLYTLEKWDLFGFAPAVLRIGQTAAFDDLGDAFVIVDEDGRIVDANTHATDLFGHPVQALVQRPIDEALGAAVDLGAGSQTVRFRTTNGYRDFDVSISTIDGSWGETFGYTLVLHDVTVERQRRQRYEVLNRILRHNLRNSMNVVVGYSRELKSSVDSSEEWMLERIEQQTLDLVELGEKARDIDRVTNTSDVRNRFHVGSGLDRVRSQLGEQYADVTVTVDAPDELAVTTSDGVFEEVVRYAAAGLLRYNETADPQIVLSAAGADSGEQRITCRITSNGDPIPENERQVIERGEETPLDHSHDLDLWLVSWGVDTLGGELEFITESDRPGIALSIPDIRPSDARDGDRDGDGDGDRDGDGDGDRDGDRDGDGDGGDDEPTGSDGHPAAGDPTSAP